MSRPPGLWFLSLLLATDPAALPASATTIDLSWDHCAPVVTNKIPVGDPGPITLFVSTTGQLAPHTGFEFRINMENAGATLPDAWRFDLMGCPGEGFMSIQTASLPPACPALQGSPATVQAGLSYQPYALPGPLGAPPYRWALQVSSRYPSTSPPPGGAQRALARFVFDHTYSVLGSTNPGYNCGGFDQNLCLSFHPGSVRWFDAGGVAIAFEPGQAWLTFRGECYPVPVRPATWGAIKGVYRE